MVVVTVNSNLTEVRQKMDRALEAALDKIGLYVQAEAKLRAPVGVYNDGSGRVGGNLRGSIEYRTDSSNKKVDIFTDVEYAHYVEHGTSKMAAQPFLTPAVQENLSNIRNIAQSEFKKIGG